MCTLQGYLADFVWAALGTERAGYAVCSLPSCPPLPPTAGRSGIPLALTCGRDRKKAREQGRGWEGGRSGEETRHPPLCPPLVFFPLRPQFILSLLNEGPRHMMGCRAPPSPCLELQGERIQGCRGHEQFTPNNSGVARGAGKGL